MEASRRAPSRVVVDQVGVVDLYERGRVRHGTQRHRLTCGMHIPPCARGKPGAQTGKQGRPVGLFQLTLDIVVSNKLAAFFESLPFVFQLGSPREGDPQRQDRREETRTRSGRRIFNLPSPRPRRLGALAGWWEFPASAQVWHRASLAPLV